MRILLTGLSGSGKTHLADNLSMILNYPTINGDIVRTSYNDWDFSYEGRLRQAYRMYSMSQGLSDVILDFIAPLSLFRNIVHPDFIIWMNTIQTSLYADTDNIFEAPTTPNIIVHSFNYSLNNIISQIQSTVI